MGKINLGFRVQRYDTKGNHVGDKTIDSGKTTSSPSATTPRTPATVTKVPKAKTSGSAVVANKGKRMTSSPKASSTTKTLTTKAKKLYK